MTEAVRASFHDQAQHCRAMDAPLTALVLQILAETLVIGGGGRPRSGLAGRSCPYR